MLCVMALSATSLSGNCEYKSFMQTIAFTEFNEHLSAISQVYDSPKNYIKSSALHYVNVSTINLSQDHHPGLDLHHQQLAVCHHTRIPLYSRSGLLCMLSLITIFVIFNVKLLWLILIRLSFSIIIWSCNNVITLSLVITFYAKVIQIYVVTSIIHINCYLHKLIYGYFYLNIYFKLISLSISIQSSTVHIDNLFNPSTLN